MSKDLVHEQKTGLSFYSYNHSCIMLLHTAWLGFLLTILLKRIISSALSFISDPQSHLAATQPPQYPSWKLSPFSCGCDCTDIPQRSSRSARDHIRNTSPATPAR